MTKKRAKWRRIECGSCGGRGMLPAYTADGGDFIGAEECGDCYGKGSIWMSERGAPAVYPGGPFERDAA
jgi:hypothetical protein